MVLSSDKSFCCSVKEKKKGSLHKVYWLRHFFSWFCGLLVWPRTNCPFFYQLKYEFVLASCQNFWFLKKKKTVTKEQYRITGVRILWSSFVYFSVPKLHQLTTKSNSMYHSVITYRKLKRACTTHIHATCTIKTLLLWLWASRCYLHSERVDYIRLY